MRINTAFVLATLYAGTALAAWGLGKNAYNKWHETELERWLADHDIPAPSPADRKELEALVKEHWNTKVGQPYQDWDIHVLQQYLADRGVELNDKTKQNKNWLLDTVKKNWYEAENVGEDAYNNVKDWIFDSWTESQLKNFLDRHGIPNPTPRKKETLLEAAKENYQTITEKLGETSAYPGNWLFEAWTESDLKRWCDERGIPVPQPTTRDKLIATIRRNSRLASLKAKAKAASATDTAKAAKESVAQKIFDSWSDSELKKWLDKNGISVPQGSTRNELLALARKNIAYLSDDTVSASMSKFVDHATESVKSGYEEATSTVTSGFEKATNTAKEYAEALFDKAIEAWSDTRLKEFLDARGVPVPQGSKRNEIIAKVRYHRHKLANKYGTWIFDSWTIDDLRDYLEDQANKASSTASTKASQVTEKAAKATDKAAKATDQASKTREELVQSAKDAYASASQAGGETYASATSRLAQTTDTAKNAAFDTWSDSDLKAYLDSYGINTYQGSTRNELIANARRAQQHFLYGTVTPTQGAFQRAKGGFNWIYNQITGVFGYGTKKAEVAKDTAKEKTQETYDRAYEKGQKGYDRSYESGQQAYDRVYEKGQEAYDRARESATRASDKVKEEL